LHKAKKSSW